MKSLAYWEALWVKVQTERTDLAWDLMPGKEPDPDRGRGKHEARADEVRRREEAKLRKLDARLAYYSERIEALRSRTFYDHVRRGGLL